ncbi:MAG: hypothetical protein SF123_24925 [Chloroflexota bacterium]|nr:hypothetical protein [Chloroflexota bacterium]
MNAPKQPNEETSVDMYDEDQGLHQPDEDEKAREQATLDAQMRLSERDIETIDAIKNDDESEFKSSD